MRTIVLSLVIAMAGAGVARAQPADPAAPKQGTPVEPANLGRPIRLGEALDVLVRQSGVLARAEADIAIAEAGRLEASGLDDWRLSATGAWQSNRRGFILGQPFQTIADDTFSANAGIERSLPSGGSFGLRASGVFAKQTFAVLDPSAPGMRTDFDSKYYQGSLIATLNHPLLGGRGSRVSRVARARAAAARTVAELARASVAADAVLDAVRAYWELAYAQRALAIQRASLQLAQEQLRITRAAIAGKAAAPTEALAIEQAIAVREQAVLLAEIEIAERSLTVRRTVGLEIGPGDIELQAVDELAISDRALDLEQLLATAREHNPRLALARKNVDVAAIDLIVADDARKPRLDLSANLGPSGAAGTAGDTGEQMVKLDSYTAGASLSYNQTLGNRAARGSQKRAQESVRRSKIDVAELERETAVAVIRAVNLVRTARKRVEVSELAIKLAEQNLESEKVLFQAGDTRAFDVLARQDELSQARLSRERALVDYLESLANLDAVTGALLDKQGITVAPK
jgi:outer membrane protein TolC